MRNLSKSQSLSRSTLLPRGVAAGILMLLASPALAQEAPEATATTSVAAPETETAAPPAAVAVTPAPAPEPAPEPAPVVAPAPAPVAAPAPPPAAPVVAPAPPPPPAPAEAPIKVTGQFFTRYEARSGYGKTSAIRALWRKFDTDAVVYRARLGLKTAALDLGDGFSSYLYFEPQAAGFITSSGGLTDPGIGIHQATVNLQTESVKLEVGRFEMAYGDHLVIGSVPWNEVGRAFDGARIKIQPSAESAWVDVFATIIHDGSTGPGRATLLVDDDRAIGAADHYFVGAYAGFGPAIGGLDLDGYLLSRIWTGGTTAGADGLDQTMPNSVKAAAEVTVGARLKGAADMFDYRFEGGLQFGARKGLVGTAGALGAVTQDPVDVFAFQVDGEVGVKPVDGLRLALGGLFASGDDPTTTDKNEGYAHLYPTAHKFIGLSDLLGPRSNIAGGSVKLQYGFSKSLKLAIDGQAYFRPEDSGAGDKGYAATEVDTGLVYTVGPGMVFRGTYALVAPNEDALGSKDLVHFLEIEFKQTIK